MRTLVTILLASLLLGTCLCAQSSGQPEPSSPPAGASSPVTMVNLDTGDKPMPLADLLKKLFDYIPGWRYHVEPSTLLNGKVVTLALRNVPFGEALDNVLKSQNLALKLGNDQIPVVYAAPSPDKAGMMGLWEKAIEISAPTSTAMAGMPSMPVMGSLPGGMPTAPTMPTPSAKPETVTICLPSMPVKDALARIEPGWSFADGLGSLTMPGVKFLRFPKDMAVAMVLGSAGLVPPTGSSRTVTSKGSIDLSAICQWKPVPAKTDQETGGGFGGGGFGGGGRGLGGGGFGGGGFGGGASAQATPGTRDEQPIAIGAYKAGSNWLFTVLAGQVLDTDLIQALLTTSGRRFVMGDIYNRPYKERQVIYTSQAQPREIVATAYVHASTITVQLFDTTLEDALDSILPAVGIRYHKAGSGANPVYVIESTNMGLHEPDNARDTSIKVKAQEAKPVTSGRRR